MKPDLRFLRSIAAYGLAPAVGLLTAPILARALGPEGRGQLAAILQPLTVADAVAAMGIPAAVTFFVARGTPTPRALGLGLRGAVVFAVLTYGVLLLYAPDVADAQGLDVVVLAALWAFVLVGALTAVRRAAWAGLGSWGLIDAERTVQATARLVVIVTIAAAGVHSVAGFAAGPLLVGTVCSVALLWRRMPQAAPLGTDPDEPAPTAGAFFRYSSLAAVGSVTLAANARLDQALMPGAVSPIELGLYAVAVTVAEVPLVVGAVLARNLFSEASRGTAPRALLRTSAVGAALAAVVAAGLYAGAGWLVPVVFGPDFVDSVGPVRLLLVASLLGLVLVVSGAILAGWGRPGRSAIAPAAAALAVVVLFAVLWDRLDATLASTVAVASQAVGAVVGSAVVVVTGRRHADRPVARGR